MIKKLNPFFIAEIGINHGGSLDKAIHLVDEAKKSGYDSVKFQTYTTEKRVKKNSNIFEILKKCELSYDDFVKINKFCIQKKIIFFSTPFDGQSAKFLNDLKVQLFKIASFDISNLKLVKIIKKFNKPVIVSTGMASKSEIDKIYNIFKSKLKNLIILHCVSSYPLKEEDSNLKKIQTLRNLYNCRIGLSDHTNDIDTVTYARLMGASVFEKHFMLKNDNCVDKKVSIDTVKSKKMISNIKFIDKVLGDGRIGIKSHEISIKQFKRYSK